MNKKLIAVIAVALLVAVACNSDDDGPAAFKKKKPAATLANDNFAGAEAFTKVPYQKTTDTTGATLEEGEPQPCPEGGFDDTVWYSFTPSRDINLLVGASASFNTVVAVYSGTDMAALTEVGCAATGTNTQISFAAGRGQTYQVQVGAVGGGEGSLSFSVGQASQASLLLGPPDPLPPGWQEKELLPETTVTTPPVGPVDLDLLTIDGKPRATDPDFYDITITAAGTPVQTIGVNTGGLLRQPIHYELVQLTVEEIEAKVRLFFRYDPEQAKCQLDVGGVCTVRLPLKATDVKWTSEKGPKAELIVQASVIAGNIDINGQNVNVDPLDPVFLRIPLLGQVSALLP